MSNEQLNVPDNLFYTDEHVWVRRVEGDTNLFIIGITDYAQDQLGEIIFVGTPDEMSKFEAGESFGDVESIKTVNELYMPISGTVMTTNEDLLDNPTLVNESPYDEGWMLKITADSVDDIENLLSAAKYNEITKS